MKNSFPFQLLPTTPSSSTCKHARDSPVPAATTALLSYQPAVAGTKNHPLPSSALPQVQLPTPPSAPLKPVSEIVPHGMFSHFPVRLASPFHPRLLLRRVSRLHPILQSLSLMIQFRLLPFLVTRFLCLRLRLRSGWGRPRKWAFVFGALSSLWIEKMLPVCGRGSLVNAANAFARNIVVFR